MELKWLLDFVSLADSGSFSKAAQQRNVTQSAFSRRIRALEGWFGAELINRSNYPIMLNEQGLQFLETAQQIIRMSYGARDDISSQNDSPAALDFTLASDLPASFLPGWLKQIEPATGMIGARIHRDCDGHQAAADRLMQQKCDFLISYESTSIRPNDNLLKFDSLTLSSDMLIPVCTNTLQTDLQIKLPVSAGSSYPYIGYRLSCFIGIALSELFNSTDQKPGLEKRYESACAEQIKNMVRQGFGVAWLNQLSIEQELKSGQLICIGDSHYHIPLAIKIYRNPSNNKADVMRTWNALAGIYSHQPRMDNTNPSLMARNKGP